MTTHPGTRVERALRALFASVIIGWAYQVWVRAPLLEGWTLSQAYILGGVGAVVIGVLAALLVRHAVDIVLAGVAGVIAGHAWAVQHTTDVILSLTLALQQTLYELRYYHVVQLALMVTAWAFGRAASARHQKLEPGHLRSDV